MNFAKIRDKKASALVIFLIAALVFTLVPYISGKADTAEAATKTASVTITEDSINYTYNLYDDNTAQLTRISAPESPQAVTVPSEITYEGASYTVTSWTTTMGGASKNITKIDLPDTITSISGYLSGYSDLTEFTVPGSVKKFEAILQNLTKLTTLSFEEGVEEIAANSMVTGCTSLSEINLPSTLTTISKSSTFRKATALKSITLPDSLVLTSSASSLFSGCTALEEVTLPKATSYIPGSCFEECTSLKSVTANGTITEIGSSAFRNCTALQSVPDLSSVCSIGTYTFQNCQKLRFENGVLDLSSLTSITNYAFYNAGNSQSSELPNEPIRQIIFSDELTSIGNSAFYGVSTLKEDLDFPDELTSIGSYAFYKAGADYDSLSSKITIPDTADSVSIGNAAFYAANYKEVYIGSEVTDIPEKTFAEQTDFPYSLETVTFNNTKEHVTITTGAIPSDVTVIYLVESIGDVGDKISDDADAMTLQEAINAAPDNEETTICIEKDVKLSAGVTVPANKKITIASKGETFTIIGDENSGIEKLISVEKDASLTLSDITVSGYGNSQSTIYNEGSLTIADGADIKEANIEDEGIGVIENAGESASFLMTGGTVYDNKITTAYGATIRLSDGATGKITGGTIQNNKVVFSYANSSRYIASSGFLVMGGCTLDVEGGTIQNNSAIRGSAIYAISNSYDARAQVTMKAGLITGNTCKRESSKTDAAGAVCVENNASFTMTGGKITDNTNGTGTHGGGVCVVDYGLHNQTTEYNTEFILDGGEISYNSASTGGGIYSYSNGTKLLSGNIKGNKATYMGGGIYCEGNKTSYATLYLENAIITGNHSGDQGGGLWSCATGSTDSSLTNGGAIYGNTADGAGDDVTITNQYTGGTHSTTLANRMLGGGKVLWYKDGSITPSTDNFLGGTSSSVPRYPETSPDPVTVEDSQAVHCLKAVADEESFELAESEATLFITDNTCASYGGGIGTNGGVKIGTESTLIDIPVTKVWDDNGYSNAKKVAVTFELITDNTVIDSVTLDGSVVDSDGNWIGEFTGLLADQEYKVIEKSIEDYDTTYEQVSENPTDGFIITNTYNPEDTPGDEPSDNPGTHDKEDGSDKPDQKVIKDAAVDTGDIAKVELIALIALIALAVAGALLAAINRKKQ